MTTNRSTVVRRAALAGAALLACAAAAAQPRTTYQVMLAVTPVAPAQAYGLNDTGVVVGSQSVPGAADQPFQWDSTIFGLPRRLPMAGGALGVGSNGSVVGSAVFDGIGLRAFAWTSAGVQNLGVLPGGGLSFASGVDDAGRIAGVSQLGGGRTHAFVIEPGATMRDLGTLGGTTSSAYGVANGVVVGSSTDASGSLQAYAWTAAGGMQGVGPIAEVSEARAVNRNGLVVGRAVVGGVDAPFLWTPGNRARLIAGADGFHAAAVNDAGQVVLRHGGGGNSMLWVEGGTATKLHTLAGSGVANFDAIAINSHAQVAGTAIGTYTLGVARPMLLTLHPDWQGGSGRWDNTGGAHWNWAGTGVAAATVGRMHDVVIDPAVDATVTVGNAEARSLRVGGRGTNAVVLAMNGELTLAAQAVFAAGSTLAGSSTLRARGITIESGAEVRAPSGMSLDGFAGVTNAGTVRAGTAIPGAMPAQLALPGGLSNLMGGHVELVNVRVDFGNSANNAGVWTWSGDTRMSSSDPQAPISIQPGGRTIYGAGRHETFSSQAWLSNGGRIELAAGAQWILDMDLHSYGDLDVASGAVLELIGGNAWADGATGWGRIEARGRLSPTVRSWTVRFEPTLAMLAGSRLVLRVGGTTPGSTGVVQGHHEKFILDSRAELSGGAFGLELIDGFVPQAGHVYDLFDWNAGVNGSFSSLMLPTLSDGLAWDVSDLYAGGTLGVTAVPEPGTWALMLAGLAAVLRRHQRPSAAPAGSRP